MRAQIHNSLRFVKKSRAALALIGLLTAGAIVVSAVSARPAVAAPLGAPVITSFTLQQVASDTWRMSGTVESNAGFGGMVLYFGGLVDEEDSPDSSGAFTLDVIAEPRPGDWVKVYAIDRWGLKSDTVTADFYP